ncbi:prominin-2 isoform X2 [Anthonomus grandis grandis]|uniref:prominin-2 isoform X2 n=1 Tax=Anthonomus grandis grandis TaxID=2921223 RepID=UPI002165A826|nr:prominin-2 isoform X2 [Anthonomus grandis grandis]
MSIKSFVCLLIPWFFCGCYNASGNTLDKTRNIASVINNITELQNNSIVANIQRQYPNNKTQVIQQAKLKFLEVPKGDELRIHDMLQEQDKYLLFEPFSSFVALLFPSGFPIDLIRKAFSNKSSTYFWIVQAIKLEMTVIFWIFFWAILALCLPVGILAASCCTTRNNRNEPYTARLKNSLGRLLYVLIFLMLCPLLLILASNEQISRSIIKSPTSVSIFYEDINTLIKNSHMQISFATTSSLDITVETIRNELENIKIHLGIPYHQELSNELGLADAINCLEVLKKESLKVNQILTDLISDCQDAKSTEKIAQNKIDDVTRQLVLIQQQCNLKERPLCFTVQLSGFDIMFPFNNITDDSRLHDFQQLNKEGSFGMAVDVARATYSNIPEKVVQDSNLYVADINSILKQKRSNVFRSTHDLDILARNISNKVSDNQEYIVPLLKKISELDVWRWLTVLVISAIVFLTLGIMFCAAPCGCGVTSKTIPLLLLGITLSCLLLLFIWALGTASLLMGGHGQSIICNSLYDHPRYKILGEFLDQDGIFQYFSNENDSIYTTNVLKGCQRDQTVYSTFHLNNKLPLEKTFNYKKWDDLLTAFDDFATARNKIEILSPGLQVQLQKLSSLTAVNFTTYRHQMTAAFTKKDLKSLADQLSSIARQLDNPVISRKLDNLAFLVRQILQNEIQMLNELRGKILYKITTLEVLLPPLNKKFIDSLTHLKSIQFFLDNDEAVVISERKKRQFISTLEYYLKDLYDYNVKKLTKEIGKCRPLWDIFHLTRFQFCKLFIDPMNAIAFSCYFFILVSLPTAPVAVKLVSIYRENMGNRGFFSSFSSRRESQENLVLREEHIWTSPSSSSSSEEIEHPQPQPYVPSAWNVRTARRGRESLKAIEPLQWKIGSVTPRSWI